MNELRFHRAANWRRLANELAAIPDALRPPDPDNPFLVRARYALVQDATAGDIVVHVDGDAPAGLADEITAVVEAHDPTPDPTPPTQAEQVDRLVADGKAAIEAAPIQTDEGRALAAIFAGALDGLGAIYGTPQGEQP
jgi:hypothetical protein